MCAVVERGPRQAIHAAAIDQCITVIAGLRAQLRSPNPPSLACRTATASRPVTIVMGVEEVVIHVNTFLNAATLIRRNAKL